MGMNLNEIDDYLGHGVYVVKVTKVIEITSQSGKDGWRCILKDKGGGRFDYNVYKGGEFKFKQLASACGITKEQMEDFEPELLVGKVCTIVVEPQKKNPKYNEATPYPREDYDAMKASYTPPPEPSNETEDDLPF